MVFSLNQILNVSLNLKLQFISKISPAYLFPLNYTELYLKRWARFLSTVTWVLQLHSLKSEKDWPVDFANLWSCESDSVYKGDTNRSVKKLAC